MLIFDKKIDLCKKYTKSAERIMFSMKKKGAEKKFGRYLVYPTLSKDVQKDSEVRT